jgi:hypothetical protein
MMREQRVESWGKRAGEAEGAERAEGEKTPVNVTLY